MLKNIKSMILSFDPSISWDEYLGFEINSYLRHKPYKETIEAGIYICGMHIGFHTDYKYGQTS